MLYKRFQGEQSGWYWGMAAALCCAALAGIILFRTPVLGVADDGTLERVIKGAGLAYPKGTEVTAGYFQRLYVWETERGTGYYSLQTMVIWIAKMLSYLFTGGWEFDIRFLGVVYLILYLPALCIFVKAAADGLTTFGQKMVSEVFAVLIFTDVGYLTYFNSFYPEALILICLMYMVGAAINLQKKSRYEMVWLLLFVIFGINLCFVRRYCFLAGITGGFFVLLQYHRQENFGRRVSTLAFGTMLVLASFASLVWMERDFNETDRFHAMSRGVLESAENPEKALSEFGIDASYSLLTDASAYEEFPLTTGENRALYDGFLDRYTTADIAGYYIRHPAQMIYGMDTAVRMNQGVRWNSLGNYEKKEGKPFGAKSIFWSLYGTFKKRVAPKRVGFPTILVLILVALNADGFSLKKEKNRQKSIHLECTVMLVIFMVLQTCLVVIQGGTPALSQYNGQLGITIDILTFFTVTELIGRLNIL